MIHTGQVDLGILHGRYINVGDLAKVRGELIWEL